MGILPSQILNPPVGIPVPLDDVSGSPPSTGAGQLAVYNDGGVLKQRAENDGAESKVIRDAPFLGPFAGPGPHQLVAGIAHLYDGSGTFTMNMPASPSDEDTVTIINVGGGAGVVTVASPHNIVRPDGVITVAYALPGISYLSLTWRFSGGFWRLTGQALFPASPKRFAIFDISVAGPTLLQADVVNFFNANASPGMVLHLPPFSSIVPGQEVTIVETGGTIDAATITTAAGTTDIINPGTGAKATSFSVGTGFGSFTWKWDNTHSGVWWLVAKS